jgi:hypothetical protein
MITLSSQPFSAGSGFVVGFIAEFERVDRQTFFPSPDGCSAQTAFPNVSLRD